MSDRAFSVDSGIAKEIYNKGRADQKEEDNAFFNFEGAWELEKKKVRADAIDEFIDKFIKRNQFKQMNKCECINAMYVLAEELKEQQ